MIKLIVGLGNPGRQYERTRHNVGFWYLDRLSQACGSSWVVDKRMQGSIAHALISGYKVHLLKPETFMNLSGRSVQALMRFYQLKAEECLVVHDELDFNPGAVRLKMSGGHGGHNGLRSIIECIGGKDFNRLRFGIGRPKGFESVADYVLSAPEKEEKEEINDAVERSLACVELLVEGKYEQVMQILHN